MSPRGVDSLESSLAAREGRPLAGYGDLRRSLDGRPLRRCNGLRNRSKHFELRFMVVQDLVRQRAIHDGPKTPQTPPALGQDFCFYTYAKPWWPPLMAARRQLLRDRRTL